MAVAEEGVQDVDCAGGVADEGDAGDVELVYQGLYDICKIKK